MAMKLYGHPMSTCTARVLASLYEMDADFELVIVNVQARENKHPSYLATKNPFGKIPALEDGDLTLFESRAINDYIATKYKGTGLDLLRLDNLKESALIKVWMEVESHSFNPPISAIVYQILITPLLGGTTDDQVVEANVEKLAMVLDVYEERLSKSKFLAGDFYSLADLHHIPYINYFMKTPKASLISSRQHVKVWWDDISSRPASKKIMEGMTIGGNA
ncbi:glutathione S-transferase F13-like [Magnolia sinica]|uniref:glutathione S-transferase F13-like n=1 Tax=Magnolia sinica TaxID=86752 RepID=UPI002658EA6D|nr:glutathione S-transferase F13-like [Magnolia sinica]